MAGAGRPRRVSLQFGESTLFLGVPGTTEEIFQRAPDRFTRPPDHPTIWTGPKQNREHPQQIHPDVDKKNRSRRLFWILDCFGFYGVGVVLEFFFVLEVSMFKVFGFWRGCFFRL